MNDTITLNDGLEGQTKVKLMILVVRPEQKIKIKRIKKNFLLQV